MASGNHGASAVMLHRQALATRRAEEMAAAAAEQRRRLIRLRVVPIILLLAFLCIVLVIVAIIRPVPTFALSASLFYIQSKEASTYSKRDLVAPWHSLQARCAASNGEPHCVPSAPVEAPQHTAYTTLFVSSTSSVTLPSPTAVNPGPPNGTTRNIVDAGTFVALWIGVLGACLQRASGSLICTGSSISPKFEATYQQSRLGTAVTCRLPKTTGGPATGLILGIVFYGLFLIYMLMATLTPAYIFTPYGKLGSPAAKYQWSIGVNALIASCALFSVAISTILLRNSFARAISSIEAIDTGLITELGSSFAHLYAVCALGGIVLLACIVLIHVSGEKQAPRKRITANQDFSFNLLDDLHAISVAGSQVSASRV